MSTALSTEISKVSTAPVFSPSGYGSEEAVALRGFAAKPRRRLLKKFTDYTFSGFYTFFVPVFPASIVGVLGIAGIAVGVASGDVLALGSGLAPFVAAGGAYSYLNSGRRSAWKQVAPVGKRSIEELDGWLTANYGLSLSGSAEELGRELLSDLQSDPYLYLSLKTTDGFRADGKLVEISPGCFELQRYSGDPVGRYFEPLPSANQLTANRAPALSITSSRSTE